MPARACAATGHVHTPWTGDAQAQHPRTHLGPGDVQVQDASHQEADAEHQQEQHSQAPRTEDTWSLWAGARRRVPGSLPASRPPAALAPGSSSSLWGHAQAGSLVGRGPRIRVLGVCEKPCPREAGPVDLAPGAGLLLACTWERQVAQGSPCGQRVAARCSRGTRLDA